MTTIETREVGICPRCGADIRDDGSSWDGHCSNEECDFDENAPEVYELHVLCTLWSVNADRTMHWRDRQDLVDQARMLTKNKAREAKLPHLGRAHIQAQPMQARGTLADTGNHYCVVKACIDGLVDAGVLDNDTAKEVANIDQLPPIRTKAGAVGMVLRLTRTRTAQHA